MSTFHEKMLFVKLFINLQQQQKELCSCAKAEQSYVICKAFAKMEPSNICALHKLFLRPWSLFNIMVHFLNDIPIQ